MAPAARMCCLGRKAGFQSKCSKELKESRDKSPRDVNACKAAANQRRDRHQFSLSNKFPLHPENFNLVLWIISLILGSLGERLEWLDHRLNALIDALP